MSERESDSSSSWGYGLFDVDHIFSSTYYGDSHQYDINISHDQYMGNGHYPSMDSGNNVHGNIEHALPEEFSQLSIGEAPEPPHTGAEYSQVSSNIQDCNGQPGLYSLYYPGYTFGPEATYDAGHSISYPSDEGKLNGGDGYSYDLEITDELELDGEVNRRLNQMVPIPHVPKINGDIPTEDEATSDHQRLLFRLQLYDLVENKIDGDGNCQFRAISDQIYRTQEHHEFVRQQVAAQLQANPEMYEGYVPMEYAEYLTRISNNGEWGDHVTLQAAADSYGMKIFVITSYKDTCYIEIVPKTQKSERVIFLSFWAEVHYNSIYPQGEDLLSSESKKKKKKWWKFGNKQ